MWVVTTVILSVVAVGIAIAYRMYGTRPVPEEVPAGSALTVAARNDLYGDALNEEVFMRPGQLVAKGLVEIDDEAVDGAGTGLAALVVPVIGRLAAVADRLRPFLRAVDVGRRGPGRRRDPGGATVVTSFPWLTVLWAVPMVGAAVVILLPASLRAVAKWLALVISVVVLAITVLLAVELRTRRRPVPVRRIPHVDPVFRHRLHPRVGRHRAGARRAHRGAGAAADRSPAGTTSATRPAWGGRSTHAYFALTLAVEGMVIMSLVSLDMLLFYVFFEAMLIPMYFLIGGFGGLEEAAPSLPRRR